LGSTRKIVKLGDTVENTSFTPPSPMKATPTTTASKSNDISTASVSKAGDVMMMSSSQKEKTLKKNSILPNKDSPEGRTTTIVAVMRGKPKNGHHRQCSNKHYKQKLVRVLLDSGSDGDFVFVDKDKPMLLPSLKRLVPQSWNTLNGMFQTKQKAEIELNFFKYSDSKRYLVEPDVVEYDKNNRPQYDLILGVKTMKKYGIIFDFKDKMITVDEVKLPMQNINYLQDSSTLRALRLNHSLAMELQSTQDATKRVTWILDAKSQKADLQAIVRDNCRHLSTNQHKKLLQILKKYELLIDGTLGDWKTKPVSFQLKEGVSPYHGRAFPVPKVHKDTIMKEVERLCQLGVLERQPASEWALSFSIIPKKDKTVCFLSDFWEGNKRLVRKPFPIPKNKHGIARDRRILLCNCPRS
jgi:hypothetical protein